MINQSSKVQLGDASSSDTVTVSAVAGQYVIKRALRNHYVRLYSDVDVYLSSKGTPTATNALVLTSGESQDIFIPLNMKTFEHLGAGAGTLRLVIVSG